MRTTEKNTIFFKTRFFTAGLIGTLGKFDPKTNTVSCYEERLLLYLTANTIADDNADRRKAIFLSEVGRDIYQVLFDLCCSDKAGSKTLDQLLKKLKDHFEPVPNEMAESFKFWTRVQQDTESITDYSLEIKKLTVHANFPALKRWLSDRFMTNIIFERAVKICCKYDDGKGTRTAV